MGLALVGVVVAASSGTAHAAGLRATAQHNRRRRMFEALPELIKAGLDIAHLVHDGHGPHRWSPGTYFANDTMADTECTTYIEAFAAVGKSKTDACMWINGKLALARPGICPSVCPMSLTPQLCSSINYGTVEYREDLWWLGTSDTVCGSAFQGGETCRAACCTWQGLLAKGWKVDHQTPYGPVYANTHNSIISRPAELAARGCLVDRQYPAFVPGWSVTADSTDFNGRPIYVRGNANASTWVKCVGPSCAGD